MMTQPGTKLRLRSPTLALEEIRGAKASVTIPHDQLLYVLGRHETDGAEMVAVDWQGRRVALFAVDIKDRVKLSNDSRKRTKCPANSA